MTQPPEAPDPASVPRWLRELHPEGGPYDLTSEGFQQAIRDVRHSDAAQARRIEREGARYLESRVFPRRQIPWTSTSQGLAARLRLLPRNPHLELDVVQIRTALGIDPGWFTRVPSDEEGLKRLGVLRPGTLEAERRLVWGHRAGTWLAVHSRSPSADDVDGDPFPLPEEARRHAAATTTTAVGASLPRWAHPAADAAGPPFAQLVTQLLGRHHLPAPTSLTLSLLFHLLTDSPYYLGHFNLPAISTELGASGVAPGYDSFTLTITGIDEYFSAEDWQAIWRHSIRPRQERYLEERGASPRGRFHRDLQRLDKAMPFYRVMVLQHKTREAVLTDPKLPLPPDVSALRASLIDLADLLTPSIDE